MRWINLALSLIALILILIVSPFAYLFIIISIFFSLALSTYAIYTKHAGTEYACAKILKEVGVIVLTLMPVIFLGGIVGMLANAQVGMRWGEVPALFRYFAIKSDSKKPHIHNLSRGHYLIICFQ